MLEKVEQAGLRKERGWPLWKRVVESAKLQ
jgi:hypothetical protein